MVRWRRPDADPAGDDDLSAERAVWLRAPGEAPREPSTGDWGGTDGDTRPEPIARPASGDYPPRHHQPSADPMVDLDNGPTRGSVYSSEGFGSLMDEPDPLPAEPDLDRPPGRRRLVPLLVITAVLAVLAAAGYGFLAGPPAAPSAASTEGPRQVTPTTAQLSFQPLAPTLTPTATSPPLSPSASVPLSPTATRSVTPTQTTTTQTTTTQAGGVVPPNPNPTFSATAGDGCNNTDPVYNWYTNGQDAAWWTGTGGAAACGGRALAMPSSGDPATDTDDYIVWWFETAPVGTGACSVDVYIPDTTRTAPAAHYKILRGRLSSTVIATYTINQAANRGQWVNLGTVSITGGAISVHLANRGGSGVFLGAGQARVSCTA